MTFELPKTRKRLERVSNNCDLNDCVFQIRSSGIRVYSLDDAFPIFAVSNSGGGAMIQVLSRERRHLSLIERRRIMGFPECFDLSDISRTDAIKQRISEMQQFLAEQTKDITEYDERLVRKLIEKITIFDRKVTVEFKSGTSVDVRR